MILSHDRKGLSCGELAAFIYPYRRKHLSPECACNDPQCDLWRRIDVRPSRVHLALFEAVPERYIHVDSSKSPIWVQEQSRLLKAQGVKVSNVLIWKTPAQFYASRKKRGLEESWAKHWVTYHRRYFSIADNWVSVPYETLVRDASALAILCQRLGLQYFDNKHRYWEHTHHTLFGNASAKIHLYDSHSEGYKASAHELIGTNGGRIPALCQGRHRQIYQDDPAEPTPEIDPAESREIDCILDILAATDFRRPSIDWTRVRRQVDPLRVPRSFFALQRVWRALRSWRTKWLF